MEDNDFTEGNVGFSPRGDGLELGGSSSLAQRPQLPSNSAREQHHGPAAATARPGGSISRAGDGSTFGVALARAWPGGGNISMARRRQQQYGPEAAAAGWPGGSHNMAPRSSGMARRPWARSSSLARR